MALIKTLKILLLKVISDIDAGNSNLTEEDLEETIELIRRMSDKTIMSKYSACEYLGVSRATFDNQVKEGIIPHGRKVAGFKELMWKKTDLDNCVKKRRC